MGHEGNCRESISEQGMSLPDTVTPDKPWNQHHRSFTIESYTGRHANSGTRHGRGSTNNKRRCGWGLWESEIRFSGTSIPCDGVEQSQFQHNTVRVFRLQAAKPDNGAGHYGKSPEQAEWRGLSDAVIFSCLVTPWYSAFGMAWNKTGNWWQDRDCRQFFQMTGQQKQLACLNHQSADECAPGHQVQVWQYDEHTVVHGRWRIQTAWGTFVVQEVIWMGLQDYRPQVVPSMICNLGKLAT